MPGGILGRDFSPLPADRQHQFDLMLQVFGLGRIGNSGAADHNGIGGLLKEKRQGAFVAAHFLDVGGIIASNSIDPAHGEKPFTVMDWNTRLDQWKNEILGHDQPLPRCSRKKSSFSCTIWSE